MHTKHSNAVQQFVTGFRFARLLLVILFALIVFFVSLQVTGYAENVILSPLPERTKEPGRPVTWIPSSSGGELRFGSVTVSVPVRFTKQGGAEIQANVLFELEGLQLPTDFLPGSIVALGIWPPNDQTQFEQPLEVRVLLDPVVLSLNEMTGVRFVQYDPLQGAWKPLTTVFHQETYELATRVKSFTPVSKNFPVWGGRTLFAIVPPAESSASSINPQPTVLRNANIRSGPGANYKIVRSAKSGEVLKLTGKSIDSKWLQLADGTWIAAFLVSDVPQLPTVETE